MGSDRVWLDLLPLKVASDCTVIVRPPSQDFALLSEFPVVQTIRLHHTIDKDHKFVFQRRELASSTKALYEARKGDDVTNATVNHRQWNRLYVLVNDDNEEDDDSNGTRSTRAVVRARARNKSHNPPKATSTQSKMKKKLRTAIGFDVVERFKKNEDALPCPVCTQYVMLKDLRVHISFHFVSYNEGSKKHEFVIPQPQWVYALDPSDNSNLLFTENGLDGYRVNGETCCLCLSGECERIVVTTDAKKGVVKAFSTCPLYAPYSYGPALSKSASNPVTNVPIKCGVSSCGQWVYAFLMDKHKETKHQQMNADSVEAVVEIDLEAIGSAWEKAKKKKLNANVNKLIEFETEENQSTNNAAHAQEKAAGKYSLQ